MGATILKHATFAFIKAAPLRTILSGPFGWFLAHVYYRVHCPGSNLTVRDCIARGECGCDNRSMKG